MSRKMSARQRSALLLSVLCLFYVPFMVQGAQEWVKKTSTEALQTAINVKSDAKQANEEKISALRS
jgi:hypothetical protein